MRRGSAVLLKSLRDQKWQVLGFGLALLAMAAIDVYIWPTYRTTVEQMKLPEAVQAFFGSDLNYATAAGFISAEFFSWIPILLIVYAVIQGTGAVAGEESSGTMDLLMAQPLSRGAMVGQKCLAAVIGTVLIIGIGYLGFLGSIPFVHIEISLGDAALASINMAPVTLLFFSLSLWLGVVAPNRAYAAGGAVALATAAYFANSLATGVDALRWLRYASPFYYYGAGLPLVRGLDWAHIALLLGLSLAFAAWAARAFVRRDITVGGAADAHLGDVLRRALA